MYESEPKPTRKIAIARGFLPILRLVSDEGRLSIVETVTNSPEQPVRATSVIKELAMAPSSFSRFAVELSRHNLISQPERGWVERTKLGVSTLEMLSIMNDRLFEIQIARLRTSFHNLGFSPQKADEEIERFKRITDEQDKAFLIIQILSSLI